MPKSKQKQQQRTDKARWQRGDIEWGITLAGYYNVQVEDEDVWDEDEGDGDDETVELWERLTARLRAVVPEGAGAEQIADGATEEDVASIIGAANGVAKRLDNADLEALLGLSDEIGQIEVEVNTIKKAVAERADERDRLLLEITGIQAPEGAEDDEREALRLAKADAEQALAALPLSPTVLQKGMDARDAVLERVRLIGEQVTSRKQEHARIRDEAGKIDDPECLDDQKKRLTDARADLAKALEPPVTTQRNIDAAKALQTFKNTLLEVTEELEALGGLESVQALCDAAGLQKGDYSAFEAALGGRQKVAEVLKTFKPAELGGLGKSFGGAEKLGSVLQGFGGAAELKTSMVGLGGTDKMVALVTKGNLDGAGAKALCDDLGGPFVGALMGKGDDPAKAIALHGEMKSDLKPLHDLAKEGGLESKPEAFAALLTTGCGGDVKKFAALCIGFGNPDDRAKLKGVIEDGGLGDAPDALGELFAVGCAGKPDELKQFGASFGDQDSRAGLKRMLTDGGLKGQKGVKDEGDIDAKCLAQLLKDGLGPKPDSFTGDDVKRRSGGLSSLFKGLSQGDCQSLKGMLSEGGLGTAPEALGHLAGIGCGGDKDKLKTLTTAFTDKPSREGLARALADSGLKGQKDVPSENDIDPKCLAQLLKDGLGPTPKGFGGDDTKRRSDGLAGLFKGLSKSEFQSLKCMLSEGGLGMAPETFGHLAGIGCDGNPDKMKSLMTAFDKPKREGLATLLTDGGLKGQKGIKDEGDIDPTCLAQMLQHAAGPVPKGFTGDDDKRRADALATLCGGLTKPEKFGAMLKKGGLGIEPEALGHLLGYGCEGGDPVKLDALSEELGKDVKNLKGLDDLLKLGGFGTKDDMGIETGTDPKCIGEMLNLGCEKKPGELTKLMTALDKTDRDRFKEMMKNGGLGTRPEVLGNSYKFGCLKDPYDDPKTYAGPTSEKDPAVLKKFLAAFGSSTDAPKLETMLQDGGLATEETWLGKIMRDGFTPRHVLSAHPSGKTQEPEKLKELYDAFVVGTSEMSKLKGMVEAMGTMPSSCGENNEPGKALQNVHKSAGVAISDLKTQFIDTLSTRGGGVNGAGGATTGVVIAGASAPPVATSLSTKELIQNAASMEFDPLVAPSPTIGSYNVDMAHVMKRHHRKGPGRDLAGGNNNTGMFPKMVPKKPDPTTGPELTLFTEAMTQAVILDAISKADAGKFMSANGPNPPNATAPTVNPPTQHSHMNTQHQRGYNNIGAAIPEGTFTVRLGFSCVPPINSGHLAGHPVRVGQFFLTGGPDYVLINYPDLDAIKTALGK